MLAPRLDFELLFADLLLEPLQIEPVLYEGGLTKTPLTEQVREESRCLAGKRIRRVRWGPPVVRANQAEQLPDSISQFSGGDRALRF